MSRATRLAGWLLVAVLAATPLVVVLLPLESGGVLTALYLLALATILLRHHIIDRTLR